MKKMNPDEMKSVTVSLPRSLAIMLKVNAAEENSSITAIIRNLCWDYLEKTATKKKAS